MSGARNGLALAPPSSRGYSALRHAQDTASAPPVSRRQPCRAHQRRVMRPALQQVYTALLMTSAGATTLNRNGGRLPVGHTDGNAGRLLALHQGVSGNSITLSVALLTPPALCVAVVFA